MAITNPSDIVTIKDVWEVQGLDGNWTEIHPDIPHSATGDEVAAKLSEFDEKVKVLISKDETKIRKSRNTLNVGLFSTEQQRSEHAVELFIGGAETRSLYKW